MLQQYFSVSPAFAFFADQVFKRDSNVFELHVEDVDPGALRERLMVAGVELPKPTSEWRGLAIQVNDTWARPSAVELSRKFAAAPGTPCPARLLPSSSASATTHPPPPRLPP